MHTNILSPLANPFSFEEQDVRTATDEKGEAWFCARDVFEALELSWKGANGIQNVPENWVMVLYLRTIKGEKPTYFISEAGVYRTIFRSNKPRALEFANWVCGEVLPALRKQGFFGTVPASQRLAFSRQIAALTKELTTTRDAFHKQSLLDELRALYTLVGQPMPSIDLLGQDPKQLALPVG